MDKANSSPSVRTGHINEVCGNSPQKLAAWALAPLRHDWLMRCAYERFSIRVRKCELAAQTSGNPIGIVDAILRPVKERWGPQGDSHRLKNRCGDKEIVLRWRIEGPQFCYGPQLRKIVLTVTRKEYAAPSADARIHFHCRSILDYGGCTSRANVAATNNGKTSVASANTWAKW